MNTSLTTFNVPGLQVFSSEIGWVPCKNNLI